MEAYVVALRVTGLDRRVHRYRPTDAALEVRSPVDPADVVAAALPEQRPAVDGAAALVCLTGAFDRLAAKYGDGGYRALAAEAGHLSENLILAATALGLRAFPVGGFFEGLLEEILGVDPARERFLLAVLLGRPGSCGGGTPLRRA